MEHIDMSLPTTEKKPPYSSATSGKPQYSTEYYYKIFYVVKKNT
jgi:hypothetical protein